MEILKFFYPAVTKFFFGKLPLEKRKFAPSHLSLDSGTFPFRRKSKEKKNNRNIFYCGALAESSDTFYVTKSNLVRRLRKLTSKKLFFERGKITSKKF